MPSTHCAERRHCGLALKQIFRAAERLRDHVAAVKPKHRVADAEAVQLARRWVALQGQRPTRSDVLHQLIGDLRNSAMPMIQESSGWTVPEDCRPI
jgi:hypothetical protein